MAQRSATKSRTASARSTAGRAAAGAKTTARKVVGPKAIGRLEKSLDAAEVALKDLRKELGRGGAAGHKELHPGLEKPPQSFPSTRQTNPPRNQKTAKGAAKG